MERVTVKVTCPYCGFYKRLNTEEHIGVDICGNVYCHSLYAFTNQGETYKIEGINNPDPEVFEQKPRVGKLGVDESNAWAGLTEEVLGKPGKEPISGMEFVKSAFEIVDEVEDETEPCNGECATMHRLEADISELVDALVWCSGTPDFAPGDNSILPRSNQARS